jgi:flagellar biosynthetic protein FliO
MFVTSLVLLAADAPEFDFEHTLTKMMLLLAILVVLGLGALWLVKRRGRPAGTSSTTMKILERRALSPKSALFLVDIGGKKLVVGDSPGGVSRIAELSTSQQPPFSEILREKISKEGAA